MDRDTLRRALYDHLRAHGRGAGISERELHDKLDLVRSGLVDSLGFVDLLAALEQAAGRQVDLERTLGQKDATTVKGVLDLFEAA